MKSPGVEVAARCRRRRCSAPPIRPAISCGDPLGLLGRLARVALVVEQDRAHAGAGQRARRQSTRWLAHSAIDVEPALVDGLGDEVGRRRGACGGCGRGRRRARAGSCRRRRAGARAPSSRRPGGWVPWETWASWSGSPSRITLRGRGGERECVGERDLAGLVDHEVVDRLAHLLAAPEPRGAGHQRRSPAAVGKSPLLVGRLDQRLVELRLERASRRPSASGGRGSRRRARRRAARPRAAGCGSPCGCWPRRRRACRRRAG